METKKEKHTHKPDWYSVQTDPKNEGIIDILCSECGEIGSTQIKSDDIQWENSDEG